MEQKELSIMQSAFQFNDGRRIIVYTSTSGIVSYECNEKWETVGKPFATCPMEYMTNKSFSEYHADIRKLHAETGNSVLVEEMSTCISPDPMIPMEQPKQYEPSLHGLVADLRNKLGCVYGHINDSSMYFATTYGTEQVEQSDVQLQEKSEKSFDCQMEIEGKAPCQEQCEHCKDYYNSKLKSSVPSIPTDEEIYNKSQEYFKEHSVYKYPQSFYVAGYKQALSDLQTKGGANG